LVARLTAVLAKVQKFEKQIHEHQKTSLKKKTIKRKPGKSKPKSNAKKPKVMCQTQNLVIVKENLKSMKVTNVVFVNYFTQSRSKKVFHH
jgi:hypothetical protein